ncbi:MAG: BMP family ABC transporter substrate-binding protein [Spirochaetaceae bacterium]|jgi:basic membrane lipoprotein Med (substrate-binding protein (PBP1-ABC) superfamily)|nr:BMP family ABC transporter substrate-binding protein [Spirochaetaceae bacterium]
MKGMRFFVFLGAALCLFASCSRGGAGGTSAPATGAASAAPAPAVIGPDFGKVKVGVLLNQTTRDGGWSQSHGTAFARVKVDLGLRDDQLIIMERVPDSGAETDAAIEALIGEGCDMIFATSAGFTQPIKNAATRYPDIKFHQFEGATLENTASYSVRDYEGIFLCGYVAGRMSRGDALGFMAAQPTASVVRAINSFARGAKYARPGATVRVIWANSWYDPAAEKEGSTSLLDSGITVLGYHGSTSAVMQAAEEAGGYATGFHIDMHDYAPKAVLTSFVWNWAPIYNEFITNYVTGNWTNATAFPGIEVGCAGVAPFNTDIIPADIIADSEAVRAKLTSGEIEVFAGPVIDNKGNRLLAEGEKFEDQELIDMMFLIDNVIGSLP